MKRVLFLAVLCLFAAGCCTVNQEAAGALESGWSLIRPDAVRGMEARVDAIPLENTPEAEREALRAQMKADELRHMEEFRLLIQEVRGAPIQ